MYDEVILGSDLSEISLVNLIDRIWILKYYMTFSFVLIYENWNSSEIHVFFISPAYRRNCTILPIFIRLLLKKILFATFWFNHAKKGIWFYFYKKLIWFHMNYLEVILVLDVSAILLQNKFKFDLICWQNKFSVSLLAAATALLFKNFKIWKIFQISEIKTDILSIRFGIIPASINNLSLKWPWQMRLDL